VHTSRQVAALCQTDGGAVHARAGKYCVGISFGHLAILTLTLGRPAAFGDFCARKTRLHVALCARNSGAKAVESYSKVQKMQQVF